MRIKKSLVLAVKSVLFSAAVIVFDYGLIGLADDFDANGKEGLGDIAGLLDYLITSPGHQFAGDPQAIYTAMFIFWMAAYFVVGLAHPMVKRYLQKPSSG